MQITVFDKELNQASILYTWISLIWREEYNGRGSFQLEVQRTPGVEETLKPWNYCLLSGQTNPMLILSVQITDNTLVANGESALYILTRRISTNTISNSGNAEEAIRSVISGMTEWPGLILGDAQNIEATYSKQIPAASAYERISKIASNADVGIRIARKGNKLVFECYQPPNNPNIKYSDMYGNVSGITYTVNQRDYANVAIVEGMASSSGRIRVEVGDTESTGIDRLELYVDAKDVQKELNESDDTYKNRLIAKGESKLDESRHADELKFNPNTDDASLGDLINIVIKSLNLRFAVRVIMIEIVHQRNTIKRNVTVGEPIIVK